MEKKKKGKQYWCHVAVSEYKSRERDLEDVIDGLAIDGLFKYKYNTITNANNNINTNTNKNKNTKKEKEIWKMW